MSAESILSKWQFKEILAAFALVGVLSVMLNLIGGLIPFVGANLTFLVAALFILVPGYFLKKRGERDVDYGLDFRDGWRGARLGLLVTALTFAVFAPAHHVWTTKIEGRAFHFDLGNYQRPGEKFFGRPAGPATDAVQVWTYGPQIHVMWLPTARPWSLQVSDAQDSPTLAGSPSTFSAGEFEPRIVDSGEAVRPVLITVHASGANTLHLQAFEGGTPIDASRYVTPGGKPLANSAGKAEIRMGLWWMLSLLLTQVVLVAIPEEFFYRGYMQERLNQALPQKQWSLGPLWLTWPIVITSVLFAIGHLFIGFGAHRLLVFFPSLLFGALKEKSGGIVAPVVFHAGCNLMVYVVSVHYF